MLVQPEQDWPPVEARGEGEGEMKLTDIQKVQTLAVELDDIGQMLYLLTRRPEDADELEVYITSTGIYDKKTYLRGATRHVVVSALREHQHQLLQQLTNLGVER